MYYGDHSVRFYPDESFVNLRTYDDPEHPAYCPDAWERWHLIPTKKVIISPPNVEDSMLKIPGRNGLVNVNKFTTGKPVYGARTGEIEFALDPNFVKDWPAIYSDILRYFHGKERCVVLKDDQYYYYKGFFSISELSPGETWDTVKLSYQLDPFKYERCPSDEEWLWDDFDFEQGVIREYWAIPVTGFAGYTTSYTVSSFYSFGEDVTPKFYGYNRTAFEREINSPGCAATVLGRLVRSIQSIPVKWPEDKNGFPIFSNAYATGNTDSDRINTLRLMLNPEGTIDCIGNLSKNAEALSELNSVLRQKLTVAIDALNKLYEIVQPEYDTASQIRSQIASMKELLPTVASCLFDVNEAAFSGIIQVRTDNDEWKNAFTHDPVVFKDIMVNLKEGTKVSDSFGQIITTDEAHLQFRTTISTIPSQISPFVSVSMRGNTL